MVNWGSIPGRVIPNTLQLVIMAYRFRAQDGGDRDTTDVSIGCRINHIENIGNLLPGYPVIHNVEHNQRLCTFWDKGDIEDEYRFVLICPA